MDDFDDFATDLGSDDFFDLEFNTPFRSRSYTWPSRPPTFQLPQVTDLEPARLTHLKDVMENEVAQLNDIGQSSHEQPPSPEGSGGVRKVASRRNAWGNLSYADLITKAIESAPEKRLTLSQIYAWMVDNVPFFSDKGDSNSSAGWKNSIRHNLSLHSRFVRFQNEGTGKSSWWTLSSDNAVKPPRKRAGTMDTMSNIRRPGKLGKLASGRNPKAARSSEMLNSLSDAATDEQWRLMDAESVSTSASLGQAHSFLEYRHRSFSGESSSNACGGQGVVLEPLLPSSWDVPYLVAEPAGLADIFLGGVSDHQQQAPLLHHLPHQPKPSPQQQQQQVFLSNESYAHGVPVHQLPVSLCHQDVSHSPSNCSSATASGPSYPSSIGNLMAGVPVAAASGISIKQQQVPILSNLLNEKPQSSVMLGGLLMSGGNMSMPVSTESSNCIMGDVCSMLPPAVEAKPPQQVMTEQVRRPFQMNQRLLMQLLANKPHLAARVQQLLDAKRRQPVTASALQQGSSQLLGAPVAPVQGPFLEQLLSGWTTASDESTSMLWNHQPSFMPYDESLPNDLDLSLLDFESTSDIDCDIDQVIQHELAFGDKLDFTFDQLHLDEFANYPC